MLIHAVTVAMPPVEAAFQGLWPEAERVNVLDDSLSPDRARDGRLTPAMTERLRMLGRYAATIGADGILFTCSAFGQAIELVAQEEPMPVLKPNEAMFEATLRHGSRLGLLATFEPSVASRMRELENLARARGKDVALEAVCVGDAMAALQAGDGESHDRLSPMQRRGFRDAMRSCLRTSRPHAPRRRSPHGSPSPCLRHPAVRF